MDSKKLKEIVSQLKGASKMHKMQANQIDKMLKSMDKGRKPSPTKAYHNKKK